MPEYDIPTLGDIPEGFFEAAGKITTGELVAILNGISNTERSYHAPTVSPSNSSSAPGQNPTVVVNGNVVGLQFATGNTAHRIFKIPGYYSSDAAFHIHWTKGSDVSEQGNAVRWKISYTVWAGNNARIDAGAPSSFVLNLDDTYDDASVDATRIVYRANDALAGGFIPLYYVGMKVECDFGNTTLVANPVLISADLTFKELINK